MRRNDKIRKILFCDNTLWGLVNFRGHIIAHLHEMGYSVVLVAPQSSDTVMKSSIPDGVEYRKIEIDRCGRNPFHDWKYFVALYSVYREVRPDYIFHYTIKPNIYGTFAAKLLGIPCTDMMTGMGYALKKKSLLNRLALYLYRMALNRADTVFCLNRENQDFILKQKFCEPQRLVLLPGGEGVDLTYFRYGYEGRGKTIFLMVARVLADKGYREFVQAAKTLKESGRNNCLFALLGPVDTSYPTHITQKELETDVDKGWIEYWGVVGDVRVVLSKPGVVVVLPSYHEGLNRSLMEACAMGKPIITTDIPGCRETVDHGKNGFLVPPCDAVALADAMSAFMDLSVEEKQTFSLHSRKKAEELFDVRHVLDEYLKILARQE